MAICRLFNNLLGGAFFHNHFTSLIWCAFSSVLRRNERDNRDRISIHSWRGCYVAIADKIQFCALHGQGNHPRLDTVCGSRNCASCSDYCCGLLHSLPRGFECSGTPGASVLSCSRLRRRDHFPRIALGTVAHFPEPTWRVAWKGTSHLGWHSNRGGP